MRNSLLNEAFALLREAKELEERDTPAVSDRSPPWDSLEQSAAKYNEACYLMKHHIRNSGSSSQNDSNNNNKLEDVARMKQLLADKIDHYERHAIELLGKVRGLKLTEKQLQQEARGDRMHNNRSRDFSHNSSGELDETSSGRSIERANYNQKFKTESSNSLLEVLCGSQLYPANAGNTAKSTVNSSTLSPVSSQTNKHEMEATQYADKANRFFGTALDHDERGESSEAINRYLQAVKCYLHAIKLLSSGSGGGGGMVKSGVHSIHQSTGSSTASTKRKELVSLERKSELALDRAEQLKSTAQNKGALSSLAAGPPAPLHTSQHHSNTSQPDRLTPYEIKVLKWSSHIASGVFLPWTDDEARKFNNSPTGSWLDSKENHLLPISDKQKKRGCRWARPSDILAMRGKSTLSCKITMVNSITPYTIKQHCVSDCSFIAGLCISAAFERRFHRRLVSSLIYPQNPTTGMPVYNPHGIYMVKLWLNGVARRVILDDFLPVDEQGKLLCSHTTTKGVMELWVPILEKAYMKLCGGYNFPGSNSGVDLFCLTGWIPERVFFPEDPNNVKDFETPAERAWERLYSANSYGDCLITVSTSKELTEEQAERVGLFTGHAYAVLGVVKTSKGTKLLQLKNPWASKGWKGRFSPHDKDSWSDPDFCAEVGYDGALASQYDDGVFWMSWDDILLYFRNIHMSWSTDPDLFRCRTAVHGYWSKNMGPDDDSYNVGENPQYTITLSERAIESNATLWILLSRHVTKQEQAGGKVSDFLTLHIHRRNNPRQCVWYPDSNCVLSGAYTNNQHVLVRYDAKGPEDRFLSIVLSQYKKSNDLGYTLSCYCTEEFELGNPEQGLPVCLKLVGSWKLRDSATAKSPSLAVGTAGGPLGRGSFGSNPQWGIRVPAEGIRIQLKCLAPKELPVNIILSRSNHRNGKDADRQVSRRIHHLYEDPLIDTGAYRHGFAVSDVSSIPAGVYTLVASTLEVGQVGEFQLHVCSSKEVEVSEID